MRPPYSGPPVLRYPGGKHRLSGWIIPYLLALPRYAEPFAGGLGVLMQRRPARVEIAADLDGDVVNFWRILRDRPRDLVDAILATPYARETWEAAYTKTDDPLQRALNLYVISWQQHHGCKGGQASGFRNPPAVPGDRDPRDQWRRADHLYAASRRLQGVEILHADALDIIVHGDADTTLYIDPPYVQATRGERWRGKMYRHEMDDAAHRRLAAALHDTKAAVVLSGYASALYDELFGGWQRAGVTTLDAAAQHKRECLWLNPAAQRSAAIGVQQQLEGLAA